MAIKKELLGDNLFFPFSFNFLLLSVLSCFLSPLLVGNTNYKKNCCTCYLKLSKRELIKKVSIDEIGVDLEHLCSCLWKQCKSSHGRFSAKNMGLVATGTAVGAVI